MKPNPWKVDVTQECILKGRQHSQKACMLSQAIRLSIPGAWSTHTRLPETSFNIGEQRYTFILPPHCFVAEALFDDKGKEALRPFSFTLHPAKALSIRAVARLGKRGPNQPRTKKNKPVGAGKCERRWKALKEKVCKL